MLVQEATPRLVRVFAQPRRKAGVVGIALLGQHIEGPQVGRSEPVVGDPVAEDARARCFLQRCARAGKVLAELRGRHLPYVAVVVALAGDLVTALRHAPHQLGVMIGDPAQHEEGRTDPVTVEQLERPLGVLLHPRLEAIPLSALDQLVERADLKVILQGDGQHMPAGSAVGSVAHWGDGLAEGNRDRVGGDELQHVTPVDVILSLTIRDTSAAMRFPLSPCPKGLTTLPAPRSSWYASSSRARSNSGLSPARRALPHSTASGRSVFLRRTSSGTPSVGASSCTPPESETISHERASRPMKSQ